MGPTECEAMSGKRAIYFGWMAAASTIGAIVTNLVSNSGANSLLRAIGVVSLLASAPLFISPFIILAKHGKRDAGQTYMETSVVVSQGPYGIIRHPQYLGYMFLNLGFALVTQTWLAAVFGAVSIGLFIAFAVQEEKLLIARFGESYLAYCRRVPRFNLIAGLVGCLRRRRI
jgi:protein-S-isoprenylcysteine O-methyltransferase Ste14